MIDLLDLDSPKRTISPALASAQADLDIARHTPASENPEIASLMIQMGDLYRESNDLEKTLSLYKEALGIIDEFANDTLGYYRIAHEIGAIHDSLGQTEEAVQYYEEAIRLSKTCRGVDACEIAAIFNNLGLTYKQSGKPELAEGQYHKALEIYERVRGVDHPEVAAMLNNLGALYTSQQNYDMAEVMHLRALSLRQKAYGGNHPDVAQSFSNLAVVYHSRQNWKKAGNYYRDALDILGKQAKTDWNEYAVVLRNYADFLRQTGKVKKGDELEAELDLRLQQLA